MQPDFHKVAEIIYTVVKTVAILVAAGWTYYQWDTVLFPTVSAERSERSSIARPDAEVLWQSIDVVQHGLLIDRDVAKDVTGAKPRKDYLVEIGGVLSVRNTRPYPIEIEFGPLSLSVASRLRRNGDEAQILEFEERLAVEIGEINKSFSLLEQAFQIEIDGIAKVPLRLAVVVNETIYHELHQYEVSGSFTVINHSLDDGRSPIQKKIKKFSTSALVNGEIFKPEVKQTPMRTTVSRTPIPSPPPPRANPPLSIGSGGVLR